MNCPKAAEEIGFLGGHRRPMVRFQLPRRQLLGTGHEGGARSRSTCAHRRLRFRRARSLLPAGPPELSRQTDPLTAEAPPTSRRRRRPPGRRGDPRAADPRAVRRPLRPEPDPPGQR
ncbi:hypothetical protein QJS66_05145 [Kocuria rhizophila]|nr:hypothetical protein QJS66_05145 [Kocuria rhizophila]